MKNPPEIEYPSIRRNEEVRDFWQRCFLYAVSAPEGTKKSPVDLVRFADQCLELSALRGMI